MPRYNNSFSNPEYREEAILDESGGLIGSLRIKPSSLLWKPSGARKYYAVPLERFTDWIVSSEAGATRTTR